MTAALSAQAPEGTRELLHLRRTRRGEVSCSSNFGLIVRVRNWDCGFSSLERGREEERRRGERGRGRKRRDGREEEEWEGGRRGREIEVRKGRREGWRGAS